MDELYNAIRSDSFEDVFQIVDSGAVDLSEDNNGPIKLAAELGRTNIVIYLKDIPGVDPTVDNNYPIIFAAINNHPDIVQTLSTIPGVNAGDSDNHAFLVTANNGNANMLRILSSLPGVDPFADNDFALEYATKNNHNESVEFLLTLYKKEPPNYVFLMNIAARNQNLPLIWIIADAEGIDSDSGADLIKWVAQKRHLSTLQFLTQQISHDVTAIHHRSNELSQYQKFHETQQVKSTLHNITLAAAAQGDTSLLTIMIEAPNVRQSVIDRSLYVAVENNQLEPVQYLSQLPSVSDNTLDTALMEAAKYGYLSIVQHLVRLPRVNIGAKARAFYQAAINNKIHVLRELNAIRGIPKLVKDASLRTARDRGYNDIVQYLQGLH